MRHGCLGLILVLAVWPPPIASAQKAADLPVVVILELKHIEETYRVLDVVAARIWPGWDDYREVPFLLGFENGLRVLVGHPNPPSGFEVIPDLRCAGRVVAVDRSKLNAVKLEPPLTAGGGPISYGQTQDGRRVEVVDMKFTRPGIAKDKTEKTAEPPTTERQILIYLHELFHCFQREHIKVPSFGNFRFNPDINFAIYSEVEGRALHRAYLEADPDKARQLLKDFLVARHMKRSGSMNENQGNEESSDELREGTATYAEMRTLEVLKSTPFKPGISTAEDGSYHGFADADKLLAQYPRSLERDAAQSESNYSKAYTYGCFQALLCQRLFPGWQESLLRSTYFPDKEIGKRIALSPDEHAAIQKSLTSAYDLEKVRQRHQEFLQARDGAYRQAKERAGRVYILDFKATEQYLSGIVNSEGSYSIGLTRVFQKGLPGLKFDEVELSPIATLVELDQLYYLRVVDTDWKKRPEPYSVAGDKQSDGSWKNARLQTPLFRLSAPHLLIKETKNRIKIRILTRAR